MKTRTKYKILFFTIVIVLFPFGFPFMVLGATYRIVHSSVRFGHDMLEEFLEFVDKKANQDAV